MQLSTDRILAEAADGIGWLTINNPERRNATSLEMWGAMSEAIEKKIEADFIATGHYVRKVERNGLHTLQRGVDYAKDQSYTLAGLSQDQ